MGARGRFVGAVLPHVEEEQVDVQFQTVSCKNETTKVFGVERPLSPSSLLPVDGYEDMSFFDIVCRKNGGGLCNKGAYGRLPNSSSQRDA